MVDDAIVVVENVELQTLGNDPRPLSFERTRRPVGPASTSSRLTVPIDEPSKWTSLLSSNTIPNLRHNRRSLRTFDPGPIQGDQLSAYGPDLHRASDPQHPVIRGLAASQGDQAILPSIKAIYHAENADDALLRLEDSKAGGTSAIPRSARPGADLGSTRFRLGCRRELSEHVGAGEGNRTLVFSLEGFWLSNTFKGHSDKLVLWRR